MLYEVLGASTSAALAIEIWDVSNVHACAGIGVVMFVSSFVSSKSVEESVAKVSIRRLNTSRIGWVVR